MDLHSASERGTQVVYGLYDSSAQSLGTRISDFFIDRQRVSIQEKSYFFHLLGVMLDAGIPVIQSLKTLTKKTTHPRFARILNTMAYDVERGKTMSQSMAKFTDVFSESEVGIVRSGEAIGKLQGLLFKLAEQTERSHELYLKVRGAMVYPIVVMLTLLVAGFIVISVVIPKLNEFFVQANVDMPVLTQLILKGGQFLIQFFWLILVCIVLISLVLSLSFGTEQGKRRFHRNILQFPWAGHLIRQLNIARFVQILSLMVEAGVPIHEALKITAGAMTNLLYKDFTLQMKQEVERGEKMANSLAAAPFLFPETVVAMISVGESTGQLGSISEKLGKHYEREVEHSLENFTSLLEPLVIVLVGIAVGVFALALLGPIFSLSNVAFQ